MATLTRKSEFIEAWLAGRLGNAPRTWGTEAELVESRFEGLVSIRSRQTSAGRWKRAGVAVADVPWVLDAMEDEGADRDQFYFNESLPDDRLIVQGEVMRGVGGVTVRYSTARGLRMWEAMRPENSREVTGVAALVVLRTLVDPNSLDDIENLLDRYDGHAVEWATYECEVGILPNRYSVIFEVRAY